VDIPLALAVHGHWRARRAAAPRPLLHALWFEHPWALAAGDTAAGAGPPARAGSARLGSRGGGAAGAPARRPGAAAAAQRDEAAAPMVAAQPFMGLPAARSGAGAGRLRRMDLEQVNGKLQAIRCGPATRSRRQSRRCRADQSPE